MRLYFKQLLDVWESGVLVSYKHDSQHDTITMLA